MQRVHCQVRQTFKHCLTNTRETALYTHVSDGLMCGSGVQVRMNRYVAHTWAFSTPSFTHTHTHTHTQAHTHPRQRLLLLESVWSYVLCLWHTAVDTHGHDTTVFTQSNKSVLTSLICTCTSLICTRTSLICTGTSVLAPRSLALKHIVPHFTAQPYTTQLEPGACCQMEPMKIQETRHSLRHSKYAESYFYVPCCMVHAWVIVM